MANHLNFIHQLYYLFFLIEVIILVFFLKKKSEILLFLLSYTSSNYYDLYIQIYANLSFLFDFNSFTYHTYISSSFPNTQFEIRSIVEAPNTQNLPSLDLDNISLHLPRSLNGWYFRSISLVDSNIFEGKLYVNFLYYILKYHFENFNFDLNIFENVPQLYLGIYIEPDLFHFINESLYITDSNNLSVLIPNDNIFAKDGIIVTFPSRNSDSIFLRIDSQIINNWKISFDHYDSLVSVYFEGIDQKNSANISLYHYRYSPLFYGYIRNLYFVNENGIILYGNSSLYDDPINNNNNEDDDSSLTLIIVFSSIGGCIGVAGISFGVVWYFKKSNLKELPEFI